MDAIRENVPLTGPPNPKHNYNKEPMEKEQKPSVHEVNHGFQHHRHAWTPGVIKRFPLTGFGALLASMLCTAAAVIVVLLSSGDLVSQWSGTRQPGVLLAYTSTVANTMMLVALAEAATIAFWTQAMKGTSVSQLHYNWAAAGGVMGALGALFRGQSIRISCVSLMVALTGLLRGPLMQRASFVQTVEVSIPGTTNLPVLTTIALNNTGWAGEVTGRSHSDVAFRTGFSQVTREFQAKAPIQIPEVNCDNCLVTVEVSRDYNIVAFSTHSAAVSPNSSYLGVWTGIWQLYYRSGKVRPLSRSTGY